jgi:hypothetical protein
VPPQFVVPDSIVELVFDQNRYCPETGQYEPSMSGHISFNNQAIIVLDGKHIIPRNIVTIITLLDPGVGWEPPKKEGTR